SIAETALLRERKSSIRVRKAGCLRSGGKGVDLVDDGIVVTVIFGGGHGRDGAATGAEDDDHGHQGGGEAEGEGVGLIEGHRSGSCLGGGGPSPARQAPDVSG